MKTALRRKFSSVLRQARQLKKKLLAKRLRPDLREIAEHTRNKLRSMCICRLGGPQSNAHIVWKTGHVIVRHYHRSCDKGDYSEIYLLFIRFPYSFMPRPLAYFPTKTLFPLCHALRFRWLSAFEGLASCFCCSLQAPYRLWLRF